MAFCWIQPTSQKRQIVCRWFINERSICLWSCQQYWSCGNLPFGRTSTGNARLACCSTKLEGQSFSYLLTNSSDVFNNLFHEFFPRMFLSLSNWKGKQTSYWSKTDFFSSSQFASWKRNHNKYSLKIRIREWWN